MAVRQYVGARYVPKFADPVEWQANTAYEALTIITYNNQSYTSKIPVPADIGIPSDNNDYWVLTGNYNGQVEQYRQETVKAQELANSVQTNLDEEITNRTTADDDIKKVIVNNIYGKQIAVCGDSWSDLGLPYHVWTDVLSTATGKDVHVNATGGFTLQQISQNFDRFKADIYIIEGGINDCLLRRPLSETLSATITLIQKIRGVNTLAEIYILIPAINLEPKKDKITGDFAYEIPFETYRQVLWHAVSTTKVYGISGLKTPPFSCGGTEDGVHPDVNNYNLSLVGKWVLNGILTKGNTRDWFYERVTTGNNTVGQLGSKTFVSVGGTRTYETNTITVYQFKEGYGSLYLGNQTNFYDIVSGQVKTNLKYWLIQDNKLSAISTLQDTSATGTGNNPLDYWVVFGECS